MKPIYLFFVLFFLDVHISFGQWVNETVDDGIEPTYHICYNYSNGLSSDEFIAKLENVNGKIAFYVASMAFCYDYDFAVVYFTLNGTMKTHTLQGSIGEDGQNIFLVANLSSSKLLYDFKAASDMRIDFFYDSCPQNIANFDMKGSTSAYHFIRQ
jgi:hypothetical protein